LGLVLCAFVEDQRQGSGQPAPPHKIPVTAPIAALDPAAERLGGWIDLDRESDRFDVARHPSSIAARTGERIRVATPKFSRRVNGPRCGRAVPGRIASTLR
jgi:hypothetical protein